MLRLAAIAAAALFVFSGVKPATAADTRNVAYAPVPMDSWIVTVKANAVAQPRWVGSDMMSAFAYPSMSFRKASDKPKFSSPDDGITIDGLQMGGISLAPVFKYRAGRYNGSMAELTGIHDTRWTLEGGIAASAWIGENIRTKVEIRRGFRYKDGFEASFGADLVKSFSNWTVAIGPRLTLADASFMRNHFGVTARDASLNSKVWATSPPPGSSRSASTARRPISSTRPGRPPSTAAMTGWSAGIRRCRKMAASTGRMTWCVIAAANCRCASLPRKSPSSARSTVRRLASA